MPNFDQTGPVGRGPASGRGFGPCGRGMSGGRKGNGMGWRRFWGCYPAPRMSEKEESSLLSEEISALEEELKSAKERLSEIKKDNKD